MNYNKFKKIQSACTLVICILLIIALTPHVSVPAGKQETEVSSYSKVRFKVMYSSDYMEPLNEAKLIKSDILYEFTNLIYLHPLGTLITILILFVLTTIITALIARSKIRTLIIQKQLTKAKAENQTKSAYLSHISHEIRTPMNAIVGLSDLTCRMDNIPDDVRDNLDKINSSAHYLLNLINNIHDISRIESGMMIISFEPFSINTLVNELEDMMSSEISRKNLVFIKDISITHDTFMGDPLRIQQVLTNLLSNAFKFTPPSGTVKLIIQETCLSSESSAVYFCVKDTGIGIPIQDQKHIFKIFDPNGFDIQKMHGTCLGLPISSNIVRLMSGRLELNSEPGLGSEFFFTLMLSLCPAPSGETTESTKDILTGINILLVEDNDLNAEVATKLLKFQNASVVRAENGQQAVELFSSREPDTFQIILMDIRMPVMNGLEAAKTIRALEREDARTIPIIAMTANSFESELKEVKEAGMNDLITKPIDLEHLNSALLKAKNH